MAPIMIGLAVCSESVVLLLLTEKWLPCVLYLRIFCITYMFWPVHTANLNAIKAMGRSDWFLRLEVIKKIMGMAILLSTMWFGVDVMAYSLLLSGFLSQLINSWPNKKLLGYSYWEQLKDFLPSLLISVLMGAIVYCVEFIDLPTIATLAIQVCTGVIVYTGLSALLKLEEFSYILEVVKSVLRGRKAK